MISTRESRRVRRRWLDPRGWTLRLGWRPVRAGVAAACLLAPVMVPSVAAAQADVFQDRQALLELFDETEGDGWHRSDNWGSDLSLDRWYGVTTDHAGRVVGLELPSNGLFGEIPAAIGSLAGLEHLDLAGNDLYGQIPS